MSDQVEDWDAWMRRRTANAIACLEAHHAFIIDYAQTLRSGRTCTMPISTKEGFKSGSQSLHFEVLWDDGAEWMLRIKLDPERQTQAARQMMIESEVATMHFMHKHGLPVPDAWTCPPLPMRDSDSVYMWCLMQRIKGKSFQRRDTPDLEFRQNTANDLADFYIRLSELPLDGLGALSLKKATDGRPVIGPGDIYLNVRDDLPTDPPTANLFGPWRTSAQYHLAYFEEVIQSIHPKELLVGLAFIEGQEIVKEDAELHREQPTFIMHGDPNGDHIFVDEQGHITGIIDWEFCTTVPFSEAFQAPIGFITLGEMLDGHVELFPMETLLMEALKRKGRDDLAQCVAESRKWHALRTSPGYPTCIELKNAFRRMWLGDKAEQFESVEQWKDWALEKFKDAPELQRFLEYAESATEESQVQ